jgi:apyrase
MPLVGSSQNLKRKPGLSSFAATPSQAGGSLRDLREFAHRIVPADQRASTPLLLQATAGLRSLSLSETEAILDSVRDELMTWGFKFERDWARVISGSEEGINGFIAANYLKGVFKPGVRQEDTFGVIEMGGASLQVTFCADRIDLLDENQRSVLVPISLAGTTFLVYTHSYMGYGQEMAAELVRKDVVDDDGDPCHLVGSFPKAKGNFRECSTKIKSALFKPQEGFCSSCSFLGNFQPSIKGEIFLAIENFFYTTKFFELDTQRNFVDLLQEKGEKWCSTPYPSAQSQYPVLSKDEVNKFCFASAYIPNLMLALGFTKPDLENSVFVAKNINNSGIDWALGGVLSHLTKPPSPRSSRYPWILLLVGIVFLVWFRKPIFRSLRARVT